MATQTIQLLSVANRTGTNVSAGRAYSNPGTFTQAFLYVDPTSEINTAHWLDLWIEKNVGGVWSNIAQTGGPMSDPAAINPHGGQPFGPMGLIISTDALAGATQVRGGYYAHLASDPPEGPFTAATIRFGIKVDLS